MKRFTFNAWLLLVGICLTLSNTAAASADGIETRMFVHKNCLSDFDRPESKGAIGAALLGIVAEPLIGAVVDLGVAAINKAAEDKVEMWPSTSLFERFYATKATGNNIFNPNISCITVISGDFGKAAIAGAAVADAQPEWLSSALARLEKKAGLKGAPHVFFEAVIVLSDDRKRFALRPRAIYFGEFQIGSGIGRTSRKFDLTITFQDIESTQPYASAKFTFDEVHKGYAALSCVENAGAKNFAQCRVNGAGETQGWFQTQPETAAMAALSTSRKVAASRLALLTTDPKDIGVEGPQIVTDYVQSDAAKNYCIELAKLKAKPATALQVDDLCPGTLIVAREKAKTDLARRQSRLDFIDAYLMYQSQCSAAMPLKQSDADFNRSRIEYIQNFPSKFAAVPVAESRISNCIEKNAPDKLAGEFTLAFTLRETRRGSAIAKFFAPVAKEVAPAVKSALVEELPAKKKEAAEKKLAADKAKAALDRTSQQAVKIVDLEVSIAENELRQAETAGDAGTILQKQILLLKKQFEANTAYRTAGLEPRFADIP